MARAKWLMQITPTMQGLGRNSTFDACPRQIYIYDKADRDQRIAAARAALDAGEILAFRCDRI